MRKLINKILLFGIITPLIPTIVGCDEISRLKCDWYLVPDLEQRHTVEKGWVSVCIKNYEINKQRCFLKANMKLAERVYAKKFRYYDAEINTKEFPREVTSIDLCEE